ncbi:hypothetical protein L1987_57780 [Smallanthus sonchifolius]|uniref:Uncharacterized protein n=1 Tax=Smallanthus sonchifolius TaxID=185202 RepID=A0ACB9DDY1_9ASTR|nr:hypothetical protein L1987_57780 [Smallanthus sonchifolius]
MWLPAESSRIKSDARTPSTSKKDFKSDAASERRENTVSAPERLEQRKPRTRESARKKTHMPKKVTFKNMEKGQMNEMEQDIMQNHDKTTTALTEAPTARI